MANNTIKRRKESTEKYIDALLENNSKLCGVRVDLKYKQEFAKDVSLDTINKDLKRMLDNRRNNKCQVQSKNVPKCSRKMYHFVTPIC